MKVSDLAKAQAKAKREHLELSMLHQLAATRLNRAEWGFGRQYVFAAPRKWALDFAWQLQKVALEVEGGLFAAGGGRHNRGAGMRADMEKYAEAAVRGWVVLRVSGDHVKGGQALAWVEQLLRQRT